jgi:dipeptidyl aminopeptidase/acylaminoacyl peptidase
MRTAGVVAQETAAKPAPVYLGLGFRDDRPPVAATPAKDSPAARAGIKKGDIILQVGNTPVADVRGTVEAVQKFKVGDKLTIKIKRNGEEMYVTVVLAPRPKVKEPSWEPEVAVQSGDYAQTRKQFRTKLLERGSAPQKEAMPNAPAGVSVVEFPSGDLRLKAWVNRPADGDTVTKPAVLFLHGGFAFGLDDWQMARPYRDAGYVVLTPILRGENGQAGVFSLLYDEVDDALAAADYLRKQPYVDRARMFIAGHSVGGILALLSAQASPHFRAAASFSGCTDQVLLCKHGIPQDDIPFDTADPREFQLRSPLAYAGSFKCPVGGRDFRAGAIDRDADFVYFLKLTGQELLRGEIA